MKIPPQKARPKGFRFPREIVAYAIWVYHRFAISSTDVEDLLAERGVTVSREPIRKWVNCFGGHFANCIRRDRSAATDKWHLDEAVIPINGRKCWRCRSDRESGPASGKAQWDASNRQSKRSGSQTECAGKCPCPRVSTFHHDRIGSVMARTPFSQLSLSPPPCCSG